jgi:hypothetical protein
MNMELSPTVRRAAAVGLLVAVLALLWLAIAAPLLQAQAEAEDTIARLTPLLERSRVVEEQIPQLQDELQQVKSRGGSDASFLQGSSEAIVTAQLQARLKTAIEQANGNLRSIQVLPVREEGPYRRVTVRADTLMNLAALRNALYDVEASTAPYLFVDGIEVRRQEQSAANKQSDDPALAVRMDISGFLRSGS